MARFLSRSLLAFAGLLLIVGGPALASDGDSATIAALVKANPLEVKLTLSDHEVTLGEHFVIDVVVKNRGAIALRDLEMTLHVIESPCLKVSGPLAHHRGILQDGRSASHAWRAQAIDGGPECRNVLVVASASALDREDSETISLESPAQLLVIR